MAKPAARSGLSGCPFLTLCGSKSATRASLRTRPCTSLALNSDGEKRVLGVWIEQTEGAKFWLKVVNELKACGVNDILIAVVDGLKGFPEAITFVGSAQRSPRCFRKPSCRPALCT
jgi:hypothetical protein